MFDTTTQTQVEMPAAFSRQMILARVTATIEHLVQDWDLGRPIDQDTLLVADLGFESIDLIQMVAALEQEFRHLNVTYAELLIVDGRYVDDLTVGQVSEFLAARA